MNTIYRRLIGKGEDDQAARIRAGGLDRRDKPVSAAGDRLNITRLFGRVSQRLAELGYSRIEAAFEINESLGWPEALTQVLAGDQFAGSSEQRAKNA